jgi:hypothetical protein
MSRERPELEPQFPIRITFEEDGSEWILDSVDDVACNLEWFDSDDPEERATAIDAEGRRVRVKVTKLEIEVFELM